MEPLRTPPSITAEQAADALRDVERGRRRVIEEIGIPRWYWGLLAACWIALGLVSDTAPPVVTTVAVLVFGAAHAAVAARVLDGRHASLHLRVRADVSGGHVHRYVVAGLVALTLLTVVGALAASADGADHPATVASVPVAVAIVLGGPALLGLVRRRAVTSPAARP